MYTTHENLQRHLFEIDVIGKSNYVQQCIIELNSMCACASLDVQQIWIQEFDVFMHFILIQ